MAAHALDVPAPLTGKTRGIPPALADLIAKCLEKDPARRPQTEQEVLRSLDAIRQGSARGGFRIPILLPSWRPGRKRASMGIIAALLVLALVYGGYHLTAQRTSLDTNVARAKAPLTIAVLPFENMSGSRENEYFSDGMTDELIQALGTVKGLEVAARTSSFAVKGKNLTVQEIGEKLHVSHVIDGSVRGSSKRLRVSAALISTGNGYRVWSETYDREPRDVFQVQDDIAQSIVSALRSTLGNSQPASGAHRMPRDLATYDLYLKGRYFWNKRTSAGLQTAANYFEQAIARDTTYALAYAGLADSYAVLAAFGYLEPKQAYAKAKPAALKAIALDSTLAEAHTSLGFTHLYYDLDPASAKREFDRAIALDPRYATAHLFNAWYYLVTGQFDNAIHEVEIARDIEPLSLIINTRLGTTERYAGRYDEAEKQLRKTLELDANFPVALDELARILASRGDYKDASVSAQRAADLGYVHGTGILGYALAMSGNRAGAERIVNVLIAKSKSEYVAPFDIGLIYMGLGNDSAAIEWFSRCKEVRDHEASHLRFDPLLKRLRRDPRFVAITSTIL